MKSAYLAVILAIAVLAAGIGYWSMTGLIAGSPEPGESNCTYSQLNYYFRQSCHLCQQVARDRSLEMLEELGVKVNKYEVLNWGMYGIYQTPTFEFGDQRIAGYKSFEELKDLLECNV